MRKANSRRTYDQKKREKKLRKFKKTFVNWRLVRTEKNAGTGKLSSVRWLRRVPGSEVE